MAVVPTTSNRFGGGGGRFSKMSKVCRIMLEKRGPSGVYLTTRLTSRNYTKGGDNKVYLFKKQRRLDKLGTVCGAREDFSVGD